ncbi:MAG: Saccharopine dehydrogenase [Peltula sp. TS41687]|nr:MAG: Saccharopine dehydrogenase [Peltula sp. TS41687]
MALRALISKIRPRQPMTAREPDQTLSTITSSLKKMPVSRPCANDDLLHALPDYPEDEDHLSGTRQAAPALVDCHLHAILTSPLFSPRSTTDTSDTLDLKIQRYKGALGIDQHFIPYPVMRFERQVALGTATPESAKLCLGMVLQARSLREKVIAMKMSRAGSAVIQWLWTSGLDTLEVLAKDEGFTTLLINHLVAEGRSDAVWKWIQIHTKPPSLAELRLRSGLLRLLIVAEARVGSGSDAAIEHFLTALHQLLKVHNVDFDEIDISSFAVRGKMKPSMEAAYIFLKPSGYSLRKALQTGLIQPQADLFHLFVRSLRFWNPSAEINRARLLLYNNHEPNPKAALAFFRAIALKELFSKPIAHLRFGLDTAQSLLERKQYKDAAWLLAYLQRIWPDELELTDDQRRAGCLERFLKDPQKYHQRATALVAFFRELVWKDILQPGQQLFSFSKKT